MRNKIFGDNNEIRPLPTPIPYLLRVVKGDQVVELDGSPFESYKANGKRHALSALKILIPCEPRKPVVARSS